MADEKNTTQTSTSLSLEAQLPRIQQGLETLGIHTPGGAEALAQYGAMLLEQNQVMNLTAITEPDQVVDLHFLDCAALSQLFSNLISLLPYFSHPLYHLIYLLFLPQFLHSTRQKYCPFLP